MGSRRKVGEEILIGRVTTVVMGEGTLRSLLQSRNKRGLAISLQTAPPLTCSLIYQFNFAV